MPDITKNQANRAYILAAILLSAITMRSAIAAVSPVLPVISSEYGLSGTVAGSFTTIPMLLFALMSLLAPLLLKRIRDTHLLILSTLLVCGGILLRSFGNIAGLFCGTLLIGIGIGLCNVLIPKKIKENFPNNLETMTGLFTAVMVFFASIGSGFSVPLANQMGWNTSLAWWSIPALMATASWVLLTRRQLSAKGPSEGLSTASAESNPHPVMSLLRSPMVLKITFCMGFQSILYYCIIAWLPTILQNKGMASDIAGYSHLIVQITGMVSAFSIPRLMSRVKDQRICIIPTCILFLIGIAALYLNIDGSMRIALLVILGLGVGPGLSYTITVLSLRASSPEQVVSASAIVQTGGYLMGAVGPMLLGKLYDIFQSVAMQVGALLLFALGYLIFATSIALHPNGKQGL